MLQRSVDIFFGLAARKRVCGILRLQNDCILSIIVLFFCVRKKRVINVHGKICIGAYTYSLLVHSQITVQPIQRSACGCGSCAAPTCQVYVSQKSSPGCFCFSHSLVRNVLYELNSFRFLKNRDEQTSRLTLQLMLASFS